MKKLIVLILISCAATSFSKNSKKCPEKFYTNALSFDKADLSGIGIDNFLKNSAKNKKDSVTNIATRVILSEVNSETLLVLRNTSGAEYFSKFIVKEEDGKFVATDIEKKIVPGNYVIIATSNNKIFGKKITVQ